MEAKFFSEYEPIQVSVVSEVVYNDIVAGFIYWIMEVKDVNFKRVVASKGMALKWKVNSWDYWKQEATEGVIWSPYDAVIDFNNIIGEVEEIPFSQYEEETKHCCLGWGGIR